MYILRYAKAFDAINYDIMLGKLEYYGIRSTALSWFKCYLIKRIQTTNIDSSYSKYSKINYGVLQGSALGPFSFLIYVNDVYLSAPEVTFHLFADDTCIFYSNKSLEQIQTILNNALNTISSWLISNKLTRNIKKSNLVLFSIGKIPQNK